MRANVKATVKVCFSPGPCLQHECLLSKAMRVLEALKRKDTVFVCLHCAAAPCTCIDAQYQTATDGSRALSSHALSLSFSRTKQADNLITHHISYFKIV